MSDKPKMIAVTDPDLADELTRDPADLSLPVTFKPNGHLWAEAEGFAAWISARTEHPA
jgi:hypothetical protein